MSKLVRDNIPEIIRQNGGVPDYRIASDDSEFQQALDLKLDEEIIELRSASDPENTAEEIADIIEVLFTIAK